MGRPQFYTTKPSGSTSLQHVFSIFRHSCDRRSCWTLSCDGLVRHSDTLAWQLSGHSSRALLLHARLTLLLPFFNLRCLSTSHVPLKSLLSRHFLAENLFCFPLYVAIIFVLETFSLLGDWSFLHYYSYEIFIVSVSTLFYFQFFSF